MSMNFNAMPIGVSQQQPGFAMSNNYSMMLGQNNMMFGNNQVGPVSMGMMMPPNFANPGNADHS
jgi:hypothetical protein